MKRFICIATYVICFFYSASPIFADESEIFTSSDKFMSIWSENITLPEEYEGVEEAYSVIKKFFEAFNNEDNELIQNYIFYPHVKLIDGQVSIFRRHSPWTIDFEDLRNNEYWDHSSLDYVEPILIKSKKIYFKIRYTRYNDEGEAYFSDSGEWILVNNNDKWKIFYISY